MELAIESFWERMDLFKHSLLIYSQISSISSFNVAKNFHLHILYVKYKMKNLYDNFRLLICIRDAI